MLVPLLAAALMAGALIALALPAGASASEACNVMAGEPLGACGMNFEEGFSHYTTGNAHEIVAYIEGGINWHLPQSKELVNSIYVNWHELPVPCTGSTMVVGGVTRPCELVYTNSVADYDIHHAGVVDASDWAEDPRVHDSNGNGYIDPEDLIAAFSNNVNHDGDGYPNDISGYDFYDNQNDPATEDSTYEHSDDQMLVIHRECPACMILPIRAGNEALDRTEDLAKAWLFAGDSGASVITSVTADLGYSSFMRETVEYLERKGVAMLESSNDFDTPDHQGGMFWPYVIPGNGSVNAPSGDEWVRSDLTSWGAHNVLTAATYGGSTSESTPTLAGAVALLQAYGLEAAEKGLISQPLNGPEAEQELIATARHITSESLAWPGGPGEWNPQYGYGIPNVYEAMKAVSENRIPPAPHIESPAWYSVHDPTTESIVPVTGTIEAPRASSFHWTLEAGLGSDPQVWTQIGEGAGKGSLSGTLGTLNLSEIPESFWKAAFSLSKTKELETTEQYAVVLRVIVTDSSGRTGVDRRAINVVHDPSSMPGFPLKLSAGGESQPALVDLQGSGHLDAVLGTADGSVDAIDPATGKELPGWPVHTDPEAVLVSHGGVDPEDEPIIADVAVGDLNHTGELDVVAATLDGKVFVWNSRGELQSGWPQTADTGVGPLPIPRPAEPYTRRPVQGIADGGPVLYGLTGSGKLDVATAGWDGYIHVWQPDGSDLPGWPVKVQMPEGFKPESGYVLVNDQKLDSPPAVAYLEGHSKEPALVVRPQYTETKGVGIQLNPFAFAFAYHANGTPVSGWPVKLKGTFEFYGSAQEFVTEGSTAPVAAPLNGTGPDDVVIGPQFSPPYLISGSGGVLAQYGAGLFFPTSISFTSSGAFGKLGTKLTFGISEANAPSIEAALEKPNSGSPITLEEGAYPATGGSSELKHFPAARQGLPFLSEPIFAPVTTGSSASLIAGGDANSLTADTSTGALAPGFPKWTTGWTLYAPSAGDLLSNGHVDLASVTREGYLFAWATEGASKYDNQWWRGQHDEWNTGNYGSVTRPPGAISKLQWGPKDKTATFIAPGGIWYEGKPTSYSVTFEPTNETVTVRATALAGRVQKVTVPKGDTGLHVQAVGATGLLGPMATLE